jgi:hypothetical protein
VRARRAHGDQVAGLEHDIAREVLEHVGDLVEIIAGIGAEPALAIDVAGDPQIVGIGDFVEGADIRPDRSKTWASTSVPPPARKADDFRWRDTTLQGVAKASTDCSGGSGE